MTKNDPFAQIFPDTPRFETPSALVFDSDADGVLDPWDCEPFNPEADGWFGDVWKKYVTPKVKKYSSSYKKYSSSGKKYVKKYSSSYKKYSSSGKKYASSHVKKYKKTIKKYKPSVKQFAKVDFKRAADRRVAVKRAFSQKAVPVTAAIRAAAAKAPVHVSRERAAERRADLVSALGVDFGRAAERRADVQAAGVLGAPKQILRGIAGMGEVFAAKPGAGARPFAAYTPAGAAERRADLLSGISSFAGKLSPIGVAAAAPGEPDRPGEARQRMIDAGVLKDRPTTITTGVGGVPGQPDRAGDVHAYVGIPKTPPGSRGERALGEEPSFWESLSTWARPVTQPLGLYGAPAEKQAMQKELGEYKAAHAKAEKMAAAYDTTYGDMGPVPPEQAAVADAARLAVLEQQDLATREHGEYIGSVGGYAGARESWFGKADKSISKHIPTLYDISDAGESFRGTHKAKIDVVRRGYEKYSPQVARDIIYPFAGGVAVGAYEAAQKHPVSVAATTAAFVAAPYVLVGAARGATALGATRVGATAVRAASKVPGVRTTARIAGPAALKYGPKALMAVWVGSAGYRVAKAPTPGEKGRVAGEMLVREAVPFALAMGAPAVVKAMPKVVKTKEYTGLVTRGRVKPVYETIEVPKITRGGVIEADLLRTPPTVSKTVVTGQTMTSPKPLLGIRTAKYTSPEGITTTHKGLQVGKSWTPAEITKMSGTKFTPTAEGTQMSAVDMLQARVGQFRYTQEGWAVGKMDAGYFLPKGKGPLQITTAEKGLVPLQDAPLLLKEGIHTPTRVYGEVVKPYMRTGEMPLAGSPARMQWVELGTRKLS
jgi:hypothetical protein